MIGDGWKIDGFLFFLYLVVVFCFFFLFFSSFSFSLLNNRMTYEYYNGSLHCKSLLYSSVCP